MSEVSDGLVGPRILFLTAEWETGPKGAPSLMFWQTQFILPPLFVVGEMQ